MVRSRGITLTRDARCYDAGVTCVDDFTVTTIRVYSERRNTYVAPSPRLPTAITETIYRDEGIREDVLERADGTFPYSLRIRHL